MIVEEIQKPIKRRRVTMAPLQTVDHCDHVQTRACSDLVECPVCHKPVCGAAVVIEYQEPISGEPLAGYVGHCRLFLMYCDSCNKIYTRLRACDASGKHFGDFFGNVGERSSVREINKFLTLHPEARGVSQ